MDFTWKKLLAIVIFFVALIVLPVFLCSSTMMSYYQTRIDREPNTDFNKWLLITSADICYKTMRPELSAEYYRKFRDLHKTDARRPYAFFRYAHSLEDCSRNADAIAEYQRFIEEYPNREEAPLCLMGIDRIRYIKPIK